MFTLAHLSDPHLGPLPDPSSMELASKRVLGYLNWRANRSSRSRPRIVHDLVADLMAQTADHIAVTGDLTNLALDAELPRAAQWLATLGPAHKVSVIPGNHDAYVPGALSKALLAWQPFLTGDDPDNGSPFPYLRCRGDIAIIGVCSARASGPFMATGYFDETQAEHLRDLLVSAAREKLFRVVLIHHPPVREKGGWFRRLIGASRFRAVVREAGAELVLHGHTHRDQRHWIDGPDRRVPVIGVPSASAAPGGHRPAARYNLFVIGETSDNRHITHIERGLSSDGEIRELSRTTLGDPANQPHQAGNETHT
jgi:3',5'-cyclic AMP phosphodiesterase CpdA